MYTFKVFIIWVFFIFNEDKNENIFIDIRITYL